MLSLCIVRKTETPEDEVHMAGDIVIKGKRAAKGERMTSGAGWRLATTKGKKRVFNATLLNTYNFGKTRIAVFKVPK